MGSLSLASRWNFGASGNSPPAPRFNVVSKPNTWSRAVAKSAQRAARGDPEGIDLNRVAYWSAFTAALEVHGGSLKPKREAPRLGYYSFTIDPKKNCYLYAFRNVAQQRIGVYLSWSGDFSQRFFLELCAQRDGIEREVGAKLDWQEIEPQRRYRATLRLENADALDEADWPRQHD